MSWDYDKFAKSEGFRGGKHRNDFYKGREPSGCLTILILIMLTVLVV